MGAGSAICFLSFARWLQKISMPHGFLFRIGEPALAVPDILDKDVREPGTVAIPNDYPLEEKNVRGEERCTF
jgi:hypothetical protein